MVERSLLVLQRRRCARMVAAFSRRARRNDPIPAGTMRLQLQNKGSNYEAYSNFGNVIVAFAFLLIPVIGWLLDKKARGTCMGPVGGTREGESESVILLVC